MPADYLSQLSAQNQCNVTTIAAFELFLSDPYKVQMKDETLQILHKGISSKELPTNMSKTDTNLKLVTKRSLHIIFIHAKTLNWPLIVKAQLLWPPQNEPRPNCSTSRICQCEEPQLRKTKTFFQKYWPVCGHLNLHSQMRTLKLQLGPGHAQHNCQHV